MSNVGTLLSVVDYHLPTDVLTNTNLDGIFSHWQSANFEKKVGIKQRH